jgi:hypothetical protein
MRPLSELFGKEREQRQSVKPTLATPLTNDALRQDALHGVAGAQEQYVIWPISHGFCPDGLYQRRVFAMQVADSGHSDRNSSLASTAGGTLSRSMVR